MTLPAANRFQALVSVPANGTQPTVTAWGVALPAPGAANVYGAFAEVLGAGWVDIAGVPVTSDAYSIDVAITANNVSAGARNTAVTIAYDPLGGTSYTEVLVNDLGACKAASITQQGGLRYSFDVHIPNGASIAAKVVTGDASLVAPYIALTLYCAPSHQHLLRTGTFVRTFGFSAADTLGTAVAGGGAAEGAWTEIGTLADDVWAWEAAFFTTDTAQNNAATLIDIGVSNDGGATMTVVAENVVIALGSVETMAKAPCGVHFPASSGYKVYARTQSGSLDASDSVVIYATGGRYTPPTPYTVAGTITIDGAPATNGKTVQIFAVDADGIADLVATTTTTGGTGAFTAAVPDNTRTYFASYANDGVYGRSALGTPV